MIPKGIGRRETRFRKEVDVATTCYGCGNQFTPSSHIRAAEVLCKGCQRDADPQPVDGRGLLAERKIG